MKAKIFLSAIIAISFTVLFSSCQKDDQVITEPLPPSTASLNHTDKFDTPYGFSISQQGAYAYTTFFFTSVDLQKNTTYTGKASRIMLDFSINPVPNATYVYKDSNSSDFDKTKNFSYASVVINGDFTSGMFQENTGTELKAEDLIGGTVTVSVKNDSYTVDYDITFKTGAITGVYYGKLPPGK